jgi:hypothetical protein
MLRGKKPAERNPRLKALMFGEAGAGKTMAAIQMPQPYIIDTEGGTEHYGEIIDKKGGAVFETTDMGEVIHEVRALATEKHPYLTLVIDPFTTLYETELEVGEGKVGSDYGRHYGYAGKTSKRLYNLIAQLDMNVIFTAHSKKLYGDQMKVIGSTFDGWKKLDYMFDLCFHLWRKDGKRIATVTKTRMGDAFPDQSSFEWSYGALIEKYGKEKLERTVEAMNLATTDQIEEFTGLYNKLNEEDLKRLKIDKTIKSADEIADLTSERAQKGIELIKKYLGV